MKNSNLSKERKEYLSSIRKEKMAIFLTQICILIGFILIWEILARKEIIDSFITSQPTRILKTFFNLTSNDLIHHISITVYETFLGFLFGTLLGSIIAILLWWSKFLQKVTEPFLVVLNSLPKVALRTYNYFMGRSRNYCYYSYGYGNFEAVLMTTYIY